MMMSSGGGEVAYIIILNILYTIHNNVLGLGVLPICNDVVGNSG